MLDLENASDSICISATDESLGLLMHKVTAVAVGISEYFLNCGAVQPRYRVLVPGPAVKSTVGAVLLSRTKVH